MTDTDISSWLGEYDGEHIVALFTPGLQHSGSAEFQVGDIVSVDRDSQTNPSLVAAASTAANRVLRVLARHQLNPVHPPDVQREAEVLARGDFSADSTLEDYTHLPFVTIDNVDSRDLDQALYLESNPAGYCVYYALADASWFVRSGTTLFAEALTRGVTYYAPGLSVRMLPAILSEDVVSLNPDEKRRALLFRITLDLQGQVLDTKVCRSLIRSRAKLSYEAVQIYYDHVKITGGAAGHAFAECDWRESLDTLKQVGKLRIEDARQRNVVDFNRREAQVIAAYDKLEIVVRDRNNTEKYNEQISLLCNIEGARLLQEHDRLSEDLQAVYRVHQPPLKQRVADFRSTLDALIDHHSLPTDWQWQHDEALADFISRLRTLASPQLQGVQQTIERLAMMTNRASEFEPEPDQHHALGVDAYARFSSPMREIVGVFTHKELLEAAGIESPQHRSLDEKLREQVIERANEGRKLQRKIEKEFQLLALNDFLTTDLAMPDDQRPWRPATLVDMRGSRLFLHVDGLAMEVKVYLEDLSRLTGFTYRVDGLRAVANEPEAKILNLGARLHIRLSSWDATRHRFLFEIQCR